MPPNLHPCAFSCIFCHRSCAHLRFPALFQILMSVVPPLNPAAQHSTASTLWDPTCVRGSSFVAVATTLVPMDPDVSVGHFNVLHPHILAPQQPKYNSGWLDEEGCI